MAAKRDPKYFGCSANVLGFLDAKCSGRSECSVRVSDRELLRQESSCYEDLMKYLETIYTCVSGKYSIFLPQICRLCHDSHVGLWQVCSWYCRFIGPIYPYYPTIISSLLFIPVYHLRMLEHWFPKNIRLLIE